MSSTTTIVPTTLVRARVLATERTVIAASAETTQALQNVPPWGPPGQAKAIFEKDSAVAELARRRGLSEWGVKEASKVGAVWEVDLIPRGGILTAGVNLVRTSSTFRAE